jgi:hypothetical protein
MLTKVTVTAHRQLIEQLIDRTVINADALPGKEGATLLDLLEKAPGVTVEQNSIQLQGRNGVTIHIDDKPTYLSDDALANYLRSLPASAVDRIELMTDPPAKYAAATVELDLYDVLRTQNNQLPVREDHKRPAASRRQWRAKRNEQGWKLKDFRYFAFIQNALCPQGKYPF